MKAYMYNWNRLRRFTRLLIIFFYSFLRMYSLALCVVRCNAGHLSVFLLALDFSYHVLVSVDFFLNFESLDCCRLRVGF